MKKRLIAMFLAISILCSMNIRVSASNQLSNIVPSYKEYSYFVEKIYITHFNCQFFFVLISKFVHIIGRITLVACSTLGSW